MEVEKVEKKEESERINLKLLKKNSDLMKIKIDRLMSNPEKPAFIPDKPKSKLPSAFRPPEFVRNVWGSSAGAGSGDFHVYRGVRRREYARQKYMNEKTKEEDLDEEFIKKMEKNMQDADEKTAKKRRKRMKAKENKKQKKGTDKEDGEEKK